MTKVGQKTPKLTLDKRTKDSLWVANPNPHLAESSDQLLVHRLVAVLSEDAEQGLPLVQGLGSLPQATGKTISDQSLEKLTISGVILLEAVFRDSMLFLVRK